MRISWTEPYALPPPLPPFPPSCPPNAQESKSKRKPSIGLVTKAQLKDALGEDLVREMSEVKRLYQRRTLASFRRKRVHNGGGGDFYDGISRENESVPLLGHSRVVDKLQVRDKRRPNSGLALSSVHKSLRLDRREGAERGDRRGYGGGG